MIGEIDSWVGAVLVDGYRKLCYVIWNFRTDSRGNRSAVEDLGGGGRVNTIDAEFFGGRNG